MVWKEEAHKIRMRGLCVGQATSYYMQTIPPIPVNPKYFDLHLTFNRFPEPGNLSEMFSAKFLSLLASQLWLQKQMNN